MSQRTENKWQMRSLQRGLALRKCEMKMNGASDQTAAVIDKSGQSSSRSFASLVYLFCFLPATVWSESWSLLKNKTQYAGEKVRKTGEKCEALFFKHHNFITAQFFEALGRLGFWSMLFRLPSFSSKINSTMSGSDHMLCCVTDQSLNIHNVLHSVKTGRAEKCDLC